MSIAKEGHIGSQARNPCGCPGLRANLTAFAPGSPRFSVSSLSATANLSSPVTSSQNLITVFPVSPNSFAAVPRSPAPWAPPPSHTATRRSSHGTPLDALQPLNPRCVERNDWRLAGLGALRSEIRQQVDEIQHVYYRVTVNVGRTCPAAATVLCPRFIVKESSGRLADRRNGCRSP